MKAAIVPTLAAASVASSTSQVDKPAAPFDAAHNVAGGTDAKAAAVQQPGAKLDSKAPESPEGDP
jgi:hypothetical protein